MSRHGSLTRAQDSNGFAARKPARDFFFPTPNPETAIMIPTRLRPALAAALCGLAAAPAAAGDIREFTPGLTVGELPAEGYVGFACGANGGRPGPDIAGWRAFAECPADGDGLHEVAFEYDDSGAEYDELEGTQIAGHEVLISLLFSGGGTVEAIRVFTNPFARPYYKRRARILANAVRARFGAGGWRCERLAPEAGEGPVGGVFVKERCVKDLGGRAVDMTARFYRRHGAEGEEIVSRTAFEIRRGPAPDS